VSTQVGQNVGNARLERLLGRGFLGESYLARQTASGRQVVAKILNDQFSGGGNFRDRFDKLVRSVAAVRDPHIVPIEDFGEAFGRYYITVPFFPDGSLRGLLQRYQTELPLARAVALMKQTADALAAAHAAGLIHRDLKPENILLTKREGTSGYAGARAQVADFGLTQLTEVGATIGGNVAFGSFPYLSPEACKGIKLTPQSDIYSLGVVLYEAITGGPPFQVKTLGDAINKHLSSDVPKPRAIVPAIPSALEDIVLKCLAKDPAARYQSAREVSAALAGLRIPGEIEINVDPPSKPEPGQPSIVVKLKQPGQPAAPQPPPIIQPPTPVIRPPQVEPPPPSGGQPPAGDRWVVRMDQPAGPSSRPPEPPPAPGPAAFGETMIGPAPELPQRGGGGAQHWQVSLNQPPGGSPPGPDVRPPGGGPAGLGDSFVPPSPGPRPPAPPARRPRPGKSSKLVTLVLDPTFITLTPGQPAVLRVTIANTSRRVEHFTVRVEGIRGPGGRPENWAEVPRERVQLIPEGRATIPIKIMVPRAAENAAGDYEVEISAVGEVSQEVGTAVMSWTVLPYFDTALTVTPARARAWRKARYTIGLVNQGNALVRCGLTATDDDHALRYEFSQQEVTLDHGVQATIDLKVRSRVRPIGTLETRNCTVRIDRLDVPPGGAPEFKAARAEFGHRAVVPTWLLPVMAALALGVYALIPRTKLAIEVTPPTLAATVDFRTRVIGVVKNQKGEVVPDGKITWMVQDSSVIQIAGIVADTVTLLPRKVGTTTLTATTSKAPAANVQVAVSIPSVETVALAPAQLSLAIGETRKLTISVADASGKRVDRDATWFSSDMSVATVGNGEVTAKAAGRAVITAQVEAKSGTANIVVRADSAGVGVVAEDCLTYEPSLLVLKKDKPNGWVVQHQGQALLRFEEKGDAEKAMQVAKRYKQHCYLGRRSGRPDSTAYYIEYWKGRSDLTKTDIKKEECTPYIPTDLTVANAGADWELRSAGQVVLRAASKSDAEKAKEIAASFTAFCQIGQRNQRPNHRLFMVQYWK